MPDPRPANIDPEGLWVHITCTDCDGMHVEAHPSNAVGKCWHCDGSLVTLRELQRLAALARLHLETEPTPDPKESTE